MQMKDFIYNLIFSQRKSLTIERETAGKTPVSFTAFMRREIMQSSMKDSTLKNHLSTLRILGQYRPNVAVQEITFSFLCDFEHFLSRQNYHCNTIAKHMKHVKRYVNLAINKDLFDVSQYPFRRYKIKHQDTTRAHLTPEELQKLEEMVLPQTGTLKKCRDMFLFSCYTGLRFSDVVRLTNDNFTLIDNKIWLVYSSMKTNINVRLPLSLLFEGRAIPIYRKYRENVDTLFGVASHANSNINKQLKQLSTIAVLEKDITFHTARHTTATLLLYNGANITTVQKLLGHKSVQTTEIYSNIMDMTIVRDLEKIRIKKKKKEFDLTA
ncbi:Tyrosine recombinase XerD [Bacteroidales bacterium Barb6]|nr:Tyrosine recombinase XerD [Bacteroidales bacterium Barb6]OAV73163.1 Tyrosine recombinase XerD [Bacteroidales bacterium Barb6]